MARQREFDPEDALDKAMHQFWAKGYFDTSIRDLIARTGVNYYGLYDAFENKHGLFLAALDHYRDTVTAEIAGQINRPGPLAEALKQALEHTLDLLQTPDGRVGCLMCNSAVEVAPHDPSVAARVRDHMALLRAAFADRLAAAQAHGELAADVKIEPLAEFLTTTVYSIGLLVRAGQDDTYIRRHIRTALSGVASTG